MMSALSHERLIVIPGLATDQRVVEPQRQAFPRMEVLPWVEPRGDDTMRSYAARLAKLVPQPHEPFHLAGISFGGMLALEMALSIRPRSVNLIGSCRGPEAVPPFILRLHGALGFMPARLYKWFGSAILAAVMRSEKLNDAQRKLLGQMVVDTEPWLFKWSCAAVVNWQPTPPPGDVPIYAVHGANDRLLKSACVDADLVIADAGHMISLTHAEQVNAFLAERINAATVHVEA